MSRECTLLQLPEGAKARIRGIDGCAAARTRLCAMGFTPGTVVELCCRSDDTCRVQLRDCCVILGRDFAKTIWCDALAADHAG